MSILDELRKLSSAEEFFLCLNVPYEAEVVHVARLHILRRMGQYLRQSEVDGEFDNLADSEISSVCRAHLEKAYQDFVVSSPIQERLFKVHKDAVAPKEAPAKPFVALSSIAMATKGP
jgi:nitrogenase-stabilizing/protective protein